GACAQPTPAPADPGPTASPTPPPPPCRPPPQGERVAQFEGPRCPWVVVAERDELRLASLELEPPADAVGAPPVCQHASCRYEGVHTPIGPMIIATEPSAQSEVPRTVFVGVVVRSTELVFIDLWAAAGPAVIEDSTALGPAHALRPMKCGDDLGLFARARLPVGDTTEPPPELRAREGRLELHSSAATKPGSSVGCTPLELPLP
ncbi:MAG TPA: hypothetical protein VFG69_13985, partial [Nannocystaceae bacterium]|nr:hypothetical protein [Nannocystaceae bacterium]